MRISKALLALWPCVWALAAGCTPPESFRGFPDSGDFLGTGGSNSPGTGGDGSGGPSGSGGDGSGGGAIEPGGTGGRGSGGAGTGGAGTGGVTIDAAMDTPQDGGGSGGARDASDSAQPRDLPPETAPILTYVNHCLPARWTAAASLQGSKAIEAIDGDPATMWWTAAPQVGNEYLQIDLGGTVKLNQVVLDNAGGNPTDYLRAYRIMVSTDGTTFPTPAASASAGPSGAVTTINFTAVNARALRIVQTGFDPTYWWTVRELRLGCQPLETPPTGAFDPLDPDHWKPSASAGGSQAAAAVDGDLATRWTSGANQQGNEWFLIDLGAATMIGEVWMNTRSSPDDSPAQYNVEVSADNQAFSSAATGAGQPLLTKVKFTPRSARYVRILQTGSSTAFWWSIDELAIRP